MRDQSNRLNSWDKRKELAKTTEIRAKELKTKQGVSDHQTHNPQNIKQKSLKLEETINREKIVETVN
jgi:hypothetical protein